jgi:hypothetical protein
MSGAASDDLDRLAEIGRKCLEGAWRGGRRNPGRDLEMAREFLATRGAVISKVSDTALKIRIGIAYCLKRSAAIDAIDRGLQNIRPPCGEPDSRV